MLSVCVYVRVCVCVCLEGSKNRNRCIQRLVKNLTCTATTGMDNTQRLMNLMAHQKLGQSGLLYRSKSPDEKSGREIGIFEPA